MQDQAHVSAAFGKVNVHRLTGDRANVKVETVKANVQVLSVPFSRVFLLR